MRRPRTWLRALTSTRGNAFRIKAKPPHKKIIGEHQEQYRTDDISPGHNESAGSDLQADRIGQGPGDDADQAIQQHEHVGNYIELLGEHK